ncbi:MAG: hypothetical protein M3Q23_10275 [Actinomycetota bacterium]|nr:hypothetical protein [Actinomycetota bacterium]
MDSGGVFIRTRSALHSDEGGFLIVETMVALGVIFIALMVLAYTVLSGFRDSATARQRQVANALTSKLIEEVRGLPYANATAGLSDSDLSGDPNIVSCSGEYHFQSCSGEKIAHTSGLPTTVPLVPHVSTIGPPNYTTTYTAKVYLTKLASSNAYRITVLVSWTSAARAASMQTQTLLYQPGSGADDSTYVAGAHSEFLYGNGTLSQGSIRAVPNAAGIQYISPWDYLSIDLPGLIGNLQSEQLTKVDASAQQIGGSMSVGGTVTIASELSASTLVDDDPTTAGATTYGTASTGAQGGLGPPSISLSGGATNGNDIHVVGGDYGNTNTLSGGAAATTSASPTNPCNGQLDSQPCGYSYIQADRTSGTSYAATMDLQDSGVTTNGSNTCKLADIVVDGQANATSYKSSVYQRIRQNGSNRIINETVTRGIGDVHLVTGLCGGSAGSGWSNQCGWACLIMSGTAWRASAEAGVGAVAPSVTVPTATLKLWNGSGYNQSTLNPGATGQDIIEYDPGNKSCSGSLCLAEIHSGCTVVGSIGFKVDVTGNLRVDGDYTSQTTGTGLITEAWARVGSPLSGTVDFSVTKWNNTTCGQSKTTVADITMSVDLGSLVAHAIYKPAA